MAPSGESQSAEAAQMRQLKSGEKERVDFTPEDQSEPSMWKTALMTATQNCLSAPVGGGLTEGMPSSTEELDSMSASGLGFGLLVKGMAKRVGAMYPGESEEQFMRRAVATTAPIANSLMTWRAGAQKRVQKFLGKQPQAPAAAPVFTQGTTVKPSQSSLAIFDAAGRELKFDDITDDYQPCMETAFDTKVWSLVCDAETATASELHETITGAHQSSADFGGGDDDAAAQ